MSGGIPNGPCSNDVDEEKVPCSPSSIVKNRDDELPLSTPELSLSESNVPSSAPSSMVVATVAAKNSADGAADSSSTVSDVTAKPDTAVEELQIETADGAFDSSSNLNITQIDENEEDVSGADKNADASDSNNDENDATVPLEADETDTNPDIDTTPASNTADGDEELQADVTDGSDKKNDDTDIEANAVAVAETADNSDHFNTTIESAEEQKIGEGDGSTVDWNEVSTEVQEESSEVSAESSPGTVNDMSRDGSGSNVSGNETTDVTTEDSPGQEDSLDTEVPSQTLYTSPDSSDSQPDDSTKVLIRFDYDLTTVNDFNSGTLSVLEDKIVTDLARIYGLIAISKNRRMTARRRQLRKLTVDDIVALDSNPVDVNVANTYECVDVNIDPNLTCTPMSGFMVARLGTGSDEEASKTAILSSIEQGMTSDTYVNSDIIKVSYIGTRSNRDDMTTTVSLLEQKKSLSSKQSSLVIGLSVFFLGFAALVGFIALRTRKKRRRSSNSDTEMNRNSIGGNEVVTEAPVVPAINNYDYNVKTMNRSSTGDEVMDFKHDTIEGRVLMLETVMEDGSEHASSIRSPSSDLASPRRFDISAIAAMGMAIPVVLQFSGRNAGTGGDKDYDSDTTDDVMENETAFKFV